LSQVQQLGREGNHLSGTGSGSPLVEVSNLKVVFRKQYGAFRKKTLVIPAVDGVNIKIMNSEVLAVVGESGSGKTTLAKCIMRLTSPESGSIYFDGSEVTGLGQRAIRYYWKNVQMIYQDPFESLNPRFDVFTTLSIPMSKLAGESNQSTLIENAKRLLMEVGLNPAETLHKYPHQLSGGERQRVNIARALAPNPRLLIADEPITMLDASQRLNILSLLMSLKAKRNLTILLITHDLASAKVMSDRIVVMYRGKVVEIGPTETILSKPYHPYTELILEVTPRIGGGDLKKGLIDTRPGIEESEGITRGCVFEPRCKYATPNCREVEPQLVDRAERHAAACHNPLQTSG
jgi:oligopeptide/dipeptide ABC transporter ATP-binding protein